LARPEPVRDPVRARWPEETTITQAERLNAIKLGGVIVATAMVFFCAAKWLPPSDSHSYSMAVAAGYTNWLPPLVAVLLAGGLAMGLVLDKDAGKAMQRICEAAEPVAHWRWHLVAGCLLSVLQVSLFPIWSSDAGYFGVRVALMAAHKLPYVDFEYAYGYATAYLPYWLHAMGLSISAALIVTLDLAVVAGVLSVGLLLQSAIARPAMRLTLFWALVVVGVLVAPGPSLNYNLGRYAAPFALVLLLVRYAPRLGLIGLFAATAAAHVLVYFISPEMGAAFSVALIAWLALSWRALPAPKLIAAGAAIVLSGAGLVVFARPMFATLFDYGQAQILLPVVPDIMMLLFVLCLPLLAGVGLRTTHLIWRGETDDAAVGPLIGGGACAALAVALIPAVVGRPWPTISIAYGFAAIVMTAGILAALGQSRAAWVVTSVFVAFVAYSAVAGIDQAWRPALGSLRHGCVFTSPDGCGMEHRQVARQDAAETGRWLQANYNNVYDPLATIGFLQPNQVNLGFYSGMDNITVDRALDRKRREVLAARLYIVSSNANQRARLSRQEPDNRLDRYRRAALYPFRFTESPDAPPSAKTQFVDALFTHCRPVAAHGTIIVCALQGGL
jgi:hypothetical protein